MTLEENEFDCATSKPIWKNSSSLTNKYTKIDEFDYRLIFNKEGRVIKVLIKIDSINDITVSDIASELVSNDMNLYVEEHYLVASTVRTSKQGEQAYLIILTTEV